ncbi:MAG: flagellar hook-associated protein FlgL [Nocardioidaceae bacterium]|nr:flagellar hook-associated protein FlgL [Nocardioidaceae bacterium]MCL2613275.1 flagellar hook-associated protein FlgL [Nocardioidaceae bacterium]
MIGRVTQRMMVNNSIGAIQSNLGKMAGTQEQMSTGKILNRPSDNPTDTTAAMRLRDSLAASQQYGRNATDGLGWLSQADTTLGGVTTDVQRAYTLALQGANTGAMGASSLDALADEIDGIRSDLLAASNTTYLGRPIFGGVTGGSTAYDASGSYVGTPGDVTRRIADGVSVKVDVDGRDVFGDGSSSVFTELSNLSTALRSGDQAGISAGIAQMQTRINTVTSARTAAGVVYQQVDKAGSTASDAQLQMTGDLSSLEDVDLAQATINLQMQQVAYQASLAATSKTIQPSLLDFLH